MLASQALVRVNRWHLCDYRRFEMFMNSHNPDARKDIRYLDRARAEDLKLP
jgi:hypothetical protein